MTTDRRDAPPPLALALLARRIPAEEREFLLGDLTELYVDRAHKIGRRRARRWFWRETARLLLQPWPASPSPRIIDPPRDTFMRTLITDIRFALRSLRRSPGLSATTILVLATGIGATSAIFSVARPALLAAPPYPDPDRLVLVWERNQQGSESNLGYLTFKDLERDSRTLQSAAAMSYWQPTLSDGQETERVDGQRVTSAFFRTLGVRPMLGRDFTAEEDRPNANRVALLSYGLWQRRFGSDSGIVGRTIAVNSVDYQVAGVLPRDFESVLAPGTAIWAPLGYESQAWACRSCRHLRAIARLKDGVPRAAAERELSDISAVYVRQFPQEYSNPGVILASVHDYVVRNTRPAMLALLGAVALVALIACANAANLLLSRALRREPEFALRTALGASRRRLASLVVSETLVVALAGGLLGILLALGGVAALTRLAPPGIPRVEQVRVDGVVLAFTLGLALVTGLATSAVPLLAAGRAAMHGILKSGSRGLAGGARHRLRAGLVVSEIGLAVALLTAATLLFRSLDRLMAVDVGFPTQRTLTMELQLSGPRYSGDTAVHQYWSAALRAVRQVPGVAAAGVVSQLPLGGNVDMYGIHLEHGASANPADDPSALRYGVSPGYLESMGIPLLRGRAIQESDTENAPFVAVVNRTMAERLFPGGEALRQRFRAGGNDGPWRTIVGIVGDTRHSGLDDPDQMQMYVPTAQWFAEGGMILVVRTTATPQNVVSAVRGAVRSVDPGVAVAKVATLDELVRRSTSQRRFALTLFEVFATIALFLAAAGIYGVLSASVVERTREIGIRGALGASRERILSLVLRQALTVTSLGLALGLVGAISLSGVSSKLLYGVRAHDPGVLLFVIVALGTIAIAACALPAWRASRVDPAIALREG